MSENVLPFKPEVVGEGYRFDPAAILDAAKDQGLTTLAVIGETENGEIYVAGSANAGETLILMERAKHCICFGSDE